MYGDGDCCYRVQFLDKEGATILDAGFKEESDNYITRSFELEDDERLVGMKSFKKKKTRNIQYEHHDT
jgi:hypothetical protein